MTQGHILKILTYNIHKGFNAAHSRFVLHQMKEAIDDIHPHIVFLQEAQGMHERHEQMVETWPEKSQSEFLAEHLWPHVVYGKNAIYEGGDHGNAILSKYPFTYWENINVSAYKNASRSLLHGIVKVPHLEKPLHIVCIHLGLFKTERSKQFDILCERIQSHIPEDEPVIIAGDFNDWQKQAEQYLEERMHLQEAFKIVTGKHAKSFPVWGPTLQVDRVYFRGLKILNCSCFSDLPWKRLSDHAPLYVEFAV